MDDSIVALWERVRESVRLADLLDIAVVACLLYIGLTWLRRRGTYSAVALLAVVLVLYEVAHWLNMYLTLALFEVGVTVLVLGFLIVFQEEVRGGLERLIARRNRKAAVGGERGESLIGNLSEALTKLAESHTGALIVLCGREPIDRHVRGGLRLNGRVSVPLLLSLFHHESPGHDGAVIISGDRIERFAAHLPLSANLYEVGERGTRHAAALGLSERCDAVVLVVSEERGTISIASEGRLRQLPSPAEGQQILEMFVENQSPTGRRRWLQIASWREWAIAAIAVFIAVLLWTPFAARGVQNIQQTVEVSVALADAPQGWAVSAPDSPTVQVTLSGSPNAFGLLDPGKLRQKIELTRLSEGWQSVVVAYDQLEGLPDGLTVVDMRPERIGFEARRESAGTIPSADEQK